MTAEDLLCTGCRELCKEGDRRTLYDLATAALENTGLYPEELAYLAFEALDLNPRGIRRVHTIEFP